MDEFFWHISDDLGPKAIFCSKSSTVEAMGPIAEPTCALCPSNHRVMFKLSTMRKITYQRVSRLERLWWETEGIKLGQFHSACFGLERHSGCLLSAACFLLITDYWLLITFHWLVLAVPIIKHIRNLSLHLHQNDKRPDTESPLYVFSYVDYATTIYTSSTLWHKLIV